TPFRSHRITFDFGTTTTLDVIAPIHANFTTASVQGHSADTWGAPAYNPAAITLGVAGNGRYHHAHRPTVAVPFAQRYVSLSVPAQASTDGATRFALGGIWAGRLTSPPRDILMAPEESKLEARTDIQTRDGRPLQRLLLDDAAWSIRRARLGETEGELAPGEKNDPQG